MKTLPNTIWGLFLLLFLGACTGCISEDDIVFKKLDNVRIERRDKDTFVAADVVLENKSGFSCTVEKTEADILVDGRLLCTMKLIGPMRLEKHSTQKWPCQLEVRPIDLLKALPSGLELLIGDKRLKTSVKGSICFRKFFLRKTHRFELTQEMDLATFRNMF
ncbi:MAG: hypothetical protein ACKO1U_07590 [Bacteroidota bacterium]